MTNGRMGGLRPDVSFFCGVPFIRKRVHEKRNKGREERRTGKIRTRKKDFSPPRTEGRPCPRTTSTSTEESRNAALVAADSTRKSSAGTASTVLSLSSAVLPAFPTGTENSTFLCMTGYENRGSNATTRERSRDRTLLGSSNSYTKGKGLTRQCTTGGIPPH